MGPPLRHYSGIAQERHKNIQTNAGEVSEKRPCGIRHIAAVLAWMVGHSISKCQTSCHRESMERWPYACEICA